MSNGLTFDIRDEEQFRLYVVKTLTELVEKIAPIPGLVNTASKVPVLEVKLDALRKEYDNDVWWDRVKIYSGPILVALHACWHKVVTGNW